MNWLPVLKTLGAGRTATARADSPAARARILAIEPECEGGRVTPAEAPVAAQQAG